MTWYDVTMKSKTTIEYAIACRDRTDKWIPACGGKEVPFMYNGTLWLYVWNAYTGEHGYLNVSTDIVQPESPHLSS